MGVLARGAVGAALVLQYLPSLPVAVAIVALQGFFRVLVAQIHSFNLLSCRLAANLADPHRLTFVPAPHFCLLSFLCDLGGGEGAASLRPNFEPTPLCG